MRRHVAALWLFWENETMHNNVASSHLNSSDSRLNVHIPPPCKPPAASRAARIVISSGESGGAGDLACPWHCGYFLLFIFS